MHAMRSPDATLQTSTGQGCWERRNKSREATGPTASEWAEALPRLPMCRRHSDAARRVASLLAPLWIWGARRTQVHGIR